MLDLTPYLNRHFGDEFTACYGEEESGVSCRPDDWPDAYLWLERFNPRYGCELRPFGSDGYGLWVHADTGEVFYYYPCARVYCDYPGVNFKPAALYYVGQLVDGDLKVLSVIDSPTCVFAEILPPLTPPDRIDNGEEQVQIVPCNFPLPPKPTNRLTFWENVRYTIEGRRPKRLEREWKEWIETADRFKEEFKNSPELLARYVEERERRGLGPEDWGDWPGLWKRVQERKAEHGF